MASAHRLLRIDRRKTLRPTHGSGHTPPVPRTVSLMDPSDGLDATRLGALENAHLTAFAAFARSTREADRRAAVAVAGHNVGPTANPKLAKRVYEGHEGTIDLVPGRGSIACVVICPSGESFAGATTIELAVKDGCGYMKHSRHPGAPEQDEVTLIGVPPAGASDLRIRTILGGTIPVPLTPDGAYWITTRAAQDVYWTRSDGTIHEHVFGRIRSRLVKNQ
jgi:hypothetical protein